MRLGPFATESLPIYSYRPTDAQLPYFLQHLLYPGVQVALCVLIPSVSIQVLLNLRHSAVSFRTKPKLNFDQRFEGWVKVWYTVRLSEWMQQLHYCSHVPTADRSIVESHSSIGRSIAGMPP